MTNRTCAVCGKRYYYCSSPDCHDSFGKPPYMSLVCSENCNDIWEITSEYYFNKNVGNDTLNDSAALLAMCDLSVLDKLEANMLVKRDALAIISKHKESVLAFALASAQETKKESADTASDTKYNIFTSDKKNKSAK